MGNDKDLTAAEVKNLQWLVSAPKIDQVVIGEDGFPATIVAPDPRAFAVHKLWLSKQKDREAVKKKRDRSQALAVCKMVLQMMPEFEFKREELRMFPEAITVDAAKIMDSLDLPPGYGD